MLTTELLEKYESAAKAHNATARSFMRVPETLSRFELLFLERLYHRDEFDGLCSGVDRHSKFANWAVLNHSRWSQMLQDELFRVVLALASTVSIKLERGETKLLPLVDRAALEENLRRAA